HGRATAALAEFIELNGFGGGSLSKRVPDWVFGLPRSQRIAFLAGYVDADGYVRDDAQNHDVSITSANEALLGDAKELLALSGIASGRVNRFTGRRVHDPDRTCFGYRLQLSGKFDRLPCRSPRRVTRMGVRKFVHGYRSAK